jgi:plasmid stabilization system protein ParE
MAVRIDFTDQARTDLADITSYLLEAAGPRTATAVTNHILARIETLSHTPRLAAVRDELGPGRRLLVCRPYVVIHRVEEASSRTTVVVLRILHGARDVRAILSEV